MVFMNQLLFFPFLSPIPYTTIKIFFLGILSVYINIIVEYVACGFYLFLSHPQLLS